MMQAQTTGLVAGLAQAALWTTMGGKGGGMTGQLGQMGIQEQRVR